MEVDKFEWAPTHDALRDLYRRIENMPVEEAGHPLQIHLDFWTTPQQKFTLIELQYLVHVKGCLWRVVGLTEDGAICSITIQTQTQQGSIEIHRFS